SLEQAAKDAGHDIHVETQGSAGSVALSATDIQAADVAIFAADVGVSGRERFAGLPVVEATVKQAINDAAGLIDKAKTASEQTPATGPTGTGPAGGGPALSTKVAADAGFGTKLRQW